MPLAQTLKPKFDMEEGCVLGMNCAICNNSGNGCGTKNVIYSAECTTCPASTETDNITSTDEQYEDVISREQYEDVISETASASSYQNPECKKAIYIGETSRPARARLQEHIKKANMLSPESFIVQHWCSHHRSETSQPKFKFKIENSCRDALS